MSDAWMTLISRKGKEISIPLSQVVEVIESPKVSHLPGVKKGVHGVTSYLGEIVTVVDLDYYLNPSVNQESALHHKARSLIVVKANGSDTAILASRIQNISTKKPIETESVDLNLLLKH